MNDMVKNKEWSYKDVQFQSYVLWHNKHENIHATWMCSFYKERYFVV